MAVGGQSPIQPATIPFATRIRSRFGRRGPRARYKRDEVIMGYLFILIPMLIFMTFSLGGMIFDFWVSFYRWAITDVPTFVGSANYNYIFHVDDKFTKALTNTAEYAIFVVPIQTAIAFFLALIVNQNIRGKTFFRTTFYFPSITSSVAGT